MRKKRIVMIGPAPEAMGGIAAVVKNYEEYGLFRKWGIVYLVTHVEGGVVRKIGAALNSLLRFIILLVLNRVALVHVHSAQFTSFWRKSIFVLIAFVVRCPVIFHLHGCEFMEFFNNHCNRISKWYVRFIFTRSTKVIALSSEWEMNIRRMAPKAEVICIYNSVNLPGISGNLEQRQRKPIILFLGRLGKRKGAYDLLEAVKKVKAVVPNVVLKCGGDGELEEIRECAQKLGLAESVEILGWVRGHQKEALLKEAAVYVLPSYNEGLPMGVLEAMSEGLPVVSTTIGGIPDAIDSGISGILIQPGDITGLARAVEMLLQSADLRQKMGDSAREKVVNTFSADKVIPRLENVYLELGASPTNLF